MTDIVGLLREDHRIMSKLLDALERQIDSAAVGNPPDYVIVGGIVDYCMAYPDRYHHPLEDAVFRCLVRLDPAHGRALPGLAEEHAALGDEIRRFAELLDEIRNEEFVRRDHFVSEARRLMARYRDHMMREEDAFLPLAEKHLSAEDAVAVLLVPARLLQQGQGLARIEADLLVLRVFVHGIREERLFCRVLVVEELVDQELPVVQVGKGLSYLAVLKQRMREVHRDADAIGSRASKKLDIAGTREHANEALDAVKILLSNEKHEKTL